jgi:hypothetical protein
MDGETDDGARVDFPIYLAILATWEGLLMWDIVTTLDKGGSRNEEESLGGRRRAQRRER